MRALPIAWRNIWRNGKRTGITVVALALTTGILVFCLSWMEGFAVDMVHSATQFYSGEVQVHAPQFLKDRSFYRSIARPEAIVAAARKAGIAVAPRSFGYGLVSLGHKSAGAQFWGVDPAAERSAFDMPHRLLAGRFLADRPHRGIVLGRKLAKSLQAEVGSEIVAVVEAGDGSMGNELFTVTGILLTMGESIDRSAAIVHRADFEQLFVARGRIHEIALNAKGGRPLEEVVAAVLPAAGAAEVKTWRELQPTLSDMVNMMDAAAWLFGMIFFLAAGLGVMNTMLMATYERIREFGVIKALGATPWRIVRSVATEALVLAVLSTAIGALAVGLPGAIWLSEWGLDLRAISGEWHFVGIAMDPVMRGVIDAKVFLDPMIVLCAISVLASLYPAIKAARIHPVRAMSHV